MPGLLQVLTAATFRAAGTLQVSDFPLIILAVSTGLQAARVRLRLSGRLTFTCFSLGIFMKTATGLYPAATHDKNSQGEDGNTDQVVG